MAKRDIQVAALEHFDWSPEQVSGSLEKAAMHATEHAVEAAAWYQRNRRGKRIAARISRFSAILLVAAAGVLPMLQQAYPAADGKAAIAPVWASILLAIAVFLVMVDRFFGLSSGWIRYVLAEAQLRSAIQRFEFEWAATQAAFGGATPTTDQCQQALVRIKAFVAEVNAIVDDETSRWVAEFQEALKQIEEQTRTPAPASQTGSLSVTVTNGEAVDAAGWSLEVDGAEPRVYTGKSAALIGLLPGDHRLSVQGKIASKAVRGEAVATVRPGASAVVQVTLA
jgi:hypothetical protein